MSRPLRSRCLWWKRDSCRVSPHGRSRLCRYRRDRSSKLPHRGRPPGRPIFLSTRFVRSDKTFASTGPKKTLAKHAKPTISHRRPCVGEDPSRFSIASAAQRSVLFVYLSTHLAGKAGWVLAYARTTTSVVALRDYSLSIAALGSPIQRRGYIGDQIFFRFDTYRQAQECIRNSRATSCLRIHCSVSHRGRMCDQTFDSA